MAERWVVIVAPNRLCFRTRSITASTAVGRFGCFLSALNSRIKYSSKAILPCFFKPSALKLRGALTQLEVQKYGGLALELDPARRSHEGFAP